MRVIVTGGRDYPDAGAVFRELRALWLEVEPKGDGLAVLHGACPTGADAHASEWCKRSKADGRRVRELRFPAPWRAFGAKAGPMRNAEMVARGANLCLAFPGGSGTADCVNRARKAGIPVKAIT